MEERYQHLDVCHALFACCSLRVVGQNLQHAVFSVLPGSHSIEDGVLRVDEEPVSSIVERARHQDEIAEWRAKWAAFTPFPQARTSAPSLGYGLPLRSQAPWHSKSSATAKGKGGPGKGSRLAQKRPPPANAEGLSAPVGPPAPGSQVAAFTWIEPGKELYVSGYVWFIGPVAKKLRVHTQSKCWPWLLSSRWESNKPAICDSWGKAGHKSADDAAHKVPPTFVWAEWSKDRSLCRLPTESERKAQAEKSTAAGITRPSSYRGRGRGRAIPRGRGRGGL